MESKRLNDWLQVIGLFAVVASLAFVGLRMKQSQEIAIAAHYQERAAMAMEYWISREQSEYSLRRIGDREITRHGLPAGMVESAAPEEVGSRIVGLHKTFLIFDNHHFQYNSGFLTEESWIKHRRSLQSLVAASLPQHFIEQHSDSFRSSFLELCEQLNEENKF